MRASLEYVDYALQQWAKWGMGGLNGWPPITLLAKMITYRGLTGAAQRGPEPEMSETIAIVEKAVLKLQQLQRSVVVKHYTNWFSVEFNAEACGVTPNHFRVLLYRAKRHVGIDLDDYLRRC